MTVGIYVLFEVLLGKLLLFQRIDLPLRLLDLLVTGLVHRKKVLVGELPGGVVAQELALFFPGQIGLLL